MKKGVENFPNYLVSDEGEIFSLRSKKTLKARVMKNGYLCIHLYNKEGRKSFLIHRLVASAFIENKLNKPCVNHKDFDRANNKESNLEWSTYKENIQYSINVGRINVSGENNPLAKLNPSKVKNIREMLSCGVDPKKIAEDFGVTRECIILVKKRKTWKHIE